MEETDKEAARTLRTRGSAARLHPSTAKVGSKRSRWCRVVALGYVLYNGVLQDAERGQLVMRKRKH